MQVTPTKPASVPVPLPVVMVNIEGSYTALDRKLWLLLLHNAWDDLDKPNIIHEAAIADVLRLFRQFGRRDLGQHGTIEQSKKTTEEGEAAAIWQSVRRLTKTTVDWEDAEYKGISTLLASAMTHKTYRESGRIYYTFSAQFAKNILIPRAFARLRIHFIMGLRSKYAVTLYEILEAYANRREPSCVVSITELRGWLKVPEESYGIWRDLRRFVIDPAIDEINERAEDAGFSVSYEGIREGKAFSKIKFSVVKTEARTEDETAIKKKSAMHKRRAQSIAGIPADPERPPFPTGDAIEAFRDKWPRHDPYEVINRWQEHWRDKGCVVLRNPDGAFLKFAEGMFKSRNAQLSR
jgi:Initiator Replication protein